MFLGITFLGAPLGGESVSRYTAWRSSQTFVFTFKVQWPFKKGDRVKISKDKTSPVEEWEPKWALLRIVQADKKSCIAVGDLKTSFLDSSPSFWIYKWVRNDEGEFLKQALSNFKDYAPPLIQKLIGEATTLHERQARVAEPVRRTVVKELVAKHGLNRSQANAITTSSSHPVSLIQGPPGTGKTTVITARADHFVDEREKC